MARSAEARSPAVIPWPVGPVTLAAVMVPENSPEVAAGQAGWLSPPHRKIITPPATWTLPKWMCDTSKLLVRLAKVTLKSMLPSGWIVALKLAVPSLLIAGTSLAPWRLARRMTTSSLSDAALITQRQNTANTARQSFFIFLVPLLLSSFFEGLSYRGPNGAQD